MRWRRSTRNRYPGAVQDQIGSPLTAAAGKHASEITAHEWHSGRVRQSDDQSALPAPTFTAAAASKRPGRSVQRRFVVVCHPATNPATAIRPLSSFLRVEQAGPLERRRWVGSSVAIHLRGGLDALSLNAALIVNTGVTAGATVMGLLARSSSAGRLRQKRDCHASTASGILGLISNDAATTFCDQRGELSGHRAGRKASDMAVCRRAAVYVRSYAR